MRLKSFCTAIFQFKMRYIILSPEKRFHYEERLTLLYSKRRGRLVFTLENRRHISFLFEVLTIYVPERSIMYVTVSACFLIRFAFRGF